MTQITIAVDIYESKVWMSQLIMPVGHGWRDLWMVVIPYNQSSTPGDEIEVSLRDWKRKDSKQQAGRNRRAYSQGALFCGIGTSSIRERSLTAGGPARRNDSWRPAPEIL
jgi:hypothetical protein